ncbi:hypothetical protein PoB_007327500 [Plakobranchus ocellatus]|uniref:Uncharacterized protein n=1 Tax=Plakobranchus ocellatus TaxID=259542 RepID=A0AAV4DRW7_9GAST|nr:hypothetical protein PoB_007327500 [Plakobranchus ocellatus]
MGVPLDIGLPLGVGSPSGRWVRAVPSSSGQYHHRSSSPAGLRSLPRPRCPTTGTRQHSVLSGPARGHHVVALTSGSSSCLHSTAVSEIHAFPHIQGTSTPTRNKLHLASLDLVFGCSMSARARHKTCVDLTADVCFRLR